MMYNYNICLIIVVKNIAYPGYSKQTLRHISLVHKRQTYKVLFTRVIFKKMHALTT